MELAAPTPMEERWPNYPQMHAAFPWRTATVDQVRAHIASGPKALGRNAYGATPLHFAASFGASCEVIEALLDAEPEWASATCTWGEGGMYHKTPLAFGLTKQTFFDNACVCSAEVANLLAARCPESASDEKGDILASLRGGDILENNVDALVISAARAKMEAVTAARDAADNEREAQQLDALMARCEVTPPVCGETAGEVARAFVAAPRGHQLALALLAPESRVQDLLSSLASIEGRMQNARDTAKWRVVDEDTAKLQAASATVDVESQSTTGGGSMWTTTKQRLTLKIDVSAPCCLLPYRRERPITQVTVHDATSS